LPNHANNALQLNAQPLRSLASAELGRYLSQLLRRPVANFVTILTGGGGKHLGRYLAEFAHRFNRGFELDRMIERLAYVACRTAPLPYRFAKMAEEHA